MLCLSSQMPKFMRYQGREKTRVQVMTTSVGFEKSKSVNSRLVQGMVRIRQWELAKVERVLGDLNPLCSSPRGSG